MVKRIQAVELSPATVEAIAQSLPTPRSKRHKELLPKILREWGRSELRNHLSREPRAIIRRRIKNLETVKQKAAQLRKAVDAVDHVGRLSIVAEIVAKGRRLENIPRGEFEDQVKRLNDERDYLTKLAGISPRQYWKTGRGRPRNVAAYLALQDAAAIYEWFTGRNAARNVDRIDGAESGPFFRFASTLWPIIFGSDAGLPAAMKNWANSRSQLDERSALIANIDLRYPTWGIFER